MCEARIDAVNRHQRGEQPSKIYKSLGKVRISLPPPLAHHNTRTMHQTILEIEGTALNLFAGVVTKSDIIAEATDIASSGRRLISASEMRLTSSQDPPGFSHPGGPNDEFNELAEVFRILKIGVLRCDVKLEPYPHNAK